MSADGPYQDVRRFCSSRKTPLMSFHVHGVPKTTCEAATPCAVVNAISGVRPVVGPMGTLMTQKL